MMLWQPVIGGDVNPARPIDRIVAGTAANIDLMVGTNTDEWRFFLLPNGVIEHITDGVLAGAVAAYGLPAEATLVAYRAAHRNASTGELLAAIQSHWYIRVPVLRLCCKNNSVSETEPTANLVGRLCSFQSEDFPDASALRSPSGNTGCRLR